MRYYLLILSLMLCTNTHAKKVIKIATYLTNNDNINNNFWNKTKQLCTAYTDKLPITFVDINKADIIISDDIYPEIGNKPIILIDRCDASTIPLKGLQHLKKNQIKAYFANHILYPLALNLSPMVHNCYHFNIINNFLKIQKPANDRSIDLKYLNKIKLVPWTNQRNVIKLTHLKSQNINFENNTRDIDVCFIGAIYNVYLPLILRPFYVGHRTQAINKLIKLKDLNTYINIINNFGSQQTEKLDFTEYINTLKKSKIVISPWGWGEWCWRDYEAIYSGAILIKPDTSFVKTIPDIYQNNITYIPCKADFSDLEEKITYVLENYDKLTPMRKYARQLLLDYNEEKFITHFANSVYDAYYS